MQADVRARANTSHHGVAGYLSIIDTPDRDDAGLGHALTCLAFDVDMVDAGDDHENAAFMLISDSPNFDFGMKHKEPTFKQVTVSDPGYCCWAARQTKPGVSLGSQPGPPSLRKRLRPARAH